MNFEAILLEIYKMLAIVLIWQNWSIAHCPSLTHWPLGDVAAQQAHTCTENVLKTRFQEVQNVNSEDVHKT